MQKKVPQNDRPLIKSANDFPVVGVGASAGGLAAFKKFLGSIPEDSGMAYVLVQHLDPKHESLLPELLQKATKVPVLEITDDIKVEPDHIYIIPSNKMLLATDGILKLSPRPAPKSNKRNLPIDLFFSSLAAVHQSHSLGVVLTGTGSDGTEGLRAIKDEGGITFAQDEASAEWKEMPRNAVNAGVVDFVLELGEIPKRIVEVISAFGQNEKGNEVRSQNEEDVFRQILALLRINKGTDFTYYKQTTIHRRILRRMVINKNKEPATYLAYLRENREAQDQLYQDLLIPVTTFFRDHDTFDKLCESTLPLIVKNKEDNGTIRLWVAGCSTGQEAYSLAICITEYLKANPELYTTKGSPSKDRVQIFASDISEPAIVKARKGIYTKNEVEEVSPGRLKEYFSKFNGGYQLNKEVRELCVFAVHNLLKDPPFGNMDLISCRNVLIYFQPYLQKKALSIFHYALNPKGYLLLGKSETTGSLPEHFTPVQKGDKLFMRKNTPEKFMPSSSKQSEQALRNREKRNMAIEKRRTDFKKTADEILLDNYTAASVVVNESMNIVLFRGKTGDYLELKSGFPSHDLTKMAKRGLAFELRNLLHKVKKGDVSVIKEKIPFDMNDGKKLISIEAVPLLNMEEPHYLIVFHPPLTPSKKSTTKKVKADEKDLRIEQLEKELMQSREDMRAITEDQEAANEELQSANEELLSSGEELQSLNEELETSKEELQSTTEEITVMNGELIGLNEQVTEERNFAEAIVSTIREPLLVLDKELKVISANSSFYKTFQVEETETEGKLIYELGNKQWDIPTLRDLLEEILPEKESLVDYEMTHTFESIGQRTMLLNAREIKRENRAKKMILLAIEDVTLRKQAIEGVAESRDQLYFAIEAAHLGTFDYNPVANKFTGNDRLKEWFGLQPEDDIALGSAIEAIAVRDQPRVSQAIQEAVQFSSGGYYDIIYNLEGRDDREEKIVRAQAQAYFDENKTAYRLTGIVEDITERKQAEEKLLESVNRYHEMIHSSPSLIAILEGEDFILTEANDAILDQLGKGKGIIGKLYLEAVPELEEQGLGDLLREVYKTGKPYYAHEMPVDLIRGEKREHSYFNFVYQPQRDTQGKIVGVAIIANEVTAQAEFNEEIRKSQARYQQLANIIPDMITNATVDGEVFYYNESWTDFSGWDMKKLKEQGWVKLMHPEEVQAVEQNWMNAVKTGNDFEMELRILDKNGDFKWHISRAIPVKDESGKITMWVGSNTEIHKLKEEEKRKEDFLKMVSHELKTPITSIKGYTQLLLSLMEGKEIQWDSLPIKPSLQRIDNQIKRLTRLISEMLDLNRIEESQLVLQKKVFNINELVEDTVQDIKYAHKQTHITFHAETSCQINADRDRIGQVLINFITNAIKYSPDDKNIEIKVFQANDTQVSVSVRDHGIGIEKKDQQNIFKRFYRVSGKNEETYSGFGIGLYLAQEIIERHDGLIRVKSKKGEGSEFIFTLPVHTKTEVKKNKGV